MLCERVRAEMTPGKFQMLSKKGKKRRLMTVKLWNLLSFTEKNPPTDGLPTAAGSRTSACPPAAEHLVGTCQTIVSSHQGKRFDVGLHQNDRQQRHLF